MLSIEEKEIDESMVLENYITKQRAKGFTDEEIKEQLVKSGWQPEKIVDALNPKKAKSSSVEKYAKYSHYLKEDEVIRNEFKIGLSTMLLTNERLIIIEKFPARLTELPYNEINIVEYYTYIKWMKLFYTILFGALSYILYTYQTMIFNRVEHYMPYLRNMIQAKAVYNLNILTVIILAAFAVIIVYNIVIFIDSLLGRLRVSPHNEGPIDLKTRLSQDVEDFISQVERYKEQK